MATNHEHEQIMEIVSDEDIAGRFKKFANPVWKGEMSLDDGAQMMVTSGGPISEMTHGSTMMAKEIILAWIGTNKVTNYGPLSKYVDLLRKSGTKDRANVIVNVLEDGYNCYAETLLTYFNKNQKKTAKVFMDMYNSVDVAYDTQKFEESMKKIFKFLMDHATVKKKSPRDYFENVINHENSREVELLATC